MSNKYSVLTGACYGAAKQELMAFEELTIFPLEAAC